jgi:gas vesicle protein
VGMPSFGKNEIAFGEGDDSMLTNLVRIGGYAMILRAAANRYALIRNRSRIAQKRSNAANLLLGGSIGTIAGVAAGLLFAPKSGRETRRQIAQRTGETVTNIKAGVSDTTERITARLHEKKSSAQEAAEICSKAIRDVMKEPVTESATKRKRK